jgi:hypothetical protein
LTFEISPPMADGTPVNESAASKPSPIVRWFIVGLPVGLIVMGALSFAFWFHKRHAKEHPPASKYASALRRELNLDDYRRYVNTFARKIGPRTPEKPANITAAQSFIESTLGFDNMGYQVTRTEFEADGRPCAHLTVELPGRKSKNALVFVTADYRDARDEDVAALLALAHAFTGTQHAKTLRFIARFGELNSGESAADATLFEVKGPAPDDAEALQKLRALEKRIEDLADGQ